MTSAGSAALSTDELRAVVRSVLRDVLPAGATAAGGADGDVAIRSDAELAAFVRQVALLCEDGARRADLQAGRHQFRLAVVPPNGAPAAAQAPPPGGSVPRVDRGAVTERAVKNAAANGKRLVVGRRAVLTPLARDRARSLGVVIEKES